MRAIIIAFLTAVSVATLEAQDTTRVHEDSAPGTTALYRNPHRAQVLGIILPGAGHIYAGEYWRGYRTWVMAVDGIGMGPFIYTLDSCSFALFSECKPGPKWPFHLLGAFMVGSGVWAWISTARDAPHAAERANERHRSRELKVRPLVEPLAGPDPELRAGLEIRW